MSSSSTAPSPGQDRYAASLRLSVAPMMDWTGEQVIYLNIK